jgi:hypothetical protein
MPMRAYAGVSLTATLISASNDAITLFADSRATVLPTVPSTHSPANIAPSFRMEEMFGRKAAAVWMWSRIVNCFACQKSPGTHISTHVKLPPSSTGNFAMAASMQSRACSGVPTNHLDDERTRCAICSCYRRVLKLKLKGEQMLPKSINKRSPMHKHLSTTTFRDGNYFVGDNIDASMSCDRSARRRKEFHDDGQDAQGSTSCCRVLYVTLRDLNMYGSQIVLHCAYSPLFCWSFPQSFRF